MTSINDLPIEVLRRVFLHLDPNSFLHVTHVSKYWRQIALWRYTLFWHIDWYLSDSKDPASFYKFYDYIKHAQSSQSSESLKIDSFQNTQAQITAAPSLDTNNDSMPFPALTYDRYIKCLGNEDSVSTKLIADQSLVLFYHRLLRFQFVGLDVSPVYLLTIPPSFFDNTPIDPQNPDSHSQIIECVSYSPDCLYLLIVKRGIDNYHFLHGYQLIDPSHKSKSSFKPFLKFFYCWKNDREVDQVVVSTDNNYLGVSYNVGFVEVHDLCLFGKNQHNMTLNTRFPLSSNGSTLDSQPSNPHTSENNCTSIYPRETILLFCRQYPSNINYLAISACGEVLFLRSQRLGGLIIVNIQEAFEIDIPHYRLDLTMSLQYHDKVLMLFGWNESIIFGKATHSIQDSEKKQSLWDYYLYLIQNNISSYVPVEKAIALPKTNAYLGIDCSQEDDVLTLKVLLDEDELFGFKSLEEAEGNKEPEDQEDQEEEDLDSEIADEEKEGKGTEVIGADSSECLIQSNPTVSNNADPNVQSDEEISNEDGYADADEEDEDEADTRPEFPILRSFSSKSDLNYCLTQDSTRLAILQDDKLYIFILHEQHLNDGFITKYLPHRIIDLNLAQLFESKDNSSRNTPSLNPNTDTPTKIEKILFIQKSHLLLRTKNKILIYQISSPQSTALSLSTDKPQSLQYLEFDSGLFIRSSPHPQ